MKYYLCLAIILVFGANRLTAQSIEPTQRNLRYAPNQQLTQFHSWDSNFLRPNNIQVGFHWGNEASIAKAEDFQLLKAKQAIH